MLGLKVLSSPLGLVGEWNGGPTGAAPQRSGAPKSRVPDAPGHQDQTRTGDCRVQKTAGCRGQRQVNHRTYIDMLHIGIFLHNMQTEKHTFFSCYSLQQLKQQKNNLMNLKKKERKKENYA